jgi:hypothetical protein
MAHRGKRIAVESDPEGEFLAALPNPGRWLVDVEADDPRVDAMGIEVDVPRRRGSRPARVDIELPDTVLRGTVSDEQGRPVPGAQGALVHLTRFAPILAATTIKTDAAGAFEIYGQTPGRAYLLARVLSTNDRSDQIEVVIGEGETTPPVHLVVQKVRLLRGRVTAAGLPVPGARVLATAFPAGGPSMLPPSDPQATADLDGVFKLMLPKSTTEVQLVVLAAGHPLSMWRARLTQEDVALALQMGASHGTLQLPRIDINYLEEDRQHLVPMLVVDGEPLGTWPLKVWAQAIGSIPVGDRLPLTGMPPGSYRYCELEPQEMLLVLWGMATPSGKTCSDGYLAAGGELTLEAPTAD